MLDFSVEGGPPNGWGLDFGGSNRKFTIGQSPKIWGNFSKICLKLIKTRNFIEKIREKFNFSESFLIFH